MDSSAYQNLWGTFLLGMVFFAMLLGVTTVQCSTYFSKFHKDPLTTRLMVVLLTLLQFGHLISYAYFTYHALITKFSTSPIATSAQVVVFPLNVSMSAIIAQLYFTYRLHKMIGRTHLTVILLVLAFSQFGLAIAATSVSLTNAPADPCKKAMPFLIAWVGIGVVLDIILSTMMCFALRKYRTGFRQTDSAVRILMIYAVSTGVLTTIISIVVLLIYAASGDHWVYVGVCMPVGGLYAISLLMNLLSRSHARQRIEEVQSQGISIHTSHIPSHVQRIFPPEATGAPARTTSRDLQG